MGYTSVGPISDGAFADYEVIQSLANNDAYLKGKLTNFTFADDSSGSRVYYNETQENIKLRIRCGTFKWTIPAGTTKNSTQIKFSSVVPPNVQITVYNTIAVNAVVYHIGTDGFYVQARNNGTTSKTFTIGWTAFCIEAV